MEIPFLENERNNRLYFDEFWKHWKLKCPVFSVFVDERVDVVVNGHSKYDSKIGSFIDDFEMQKLTKEDKAQVRDTVLDLRESKYKLDLSVLDEKCTCYTCTRRMTRAYIYHLIQCKEMLASVLLQIHNLHQINE